MKNIIHYKNYAYTFSGLLIVASVVVLLMWGLNLGIDFKGGTLVSVQYTQESEVPSRESITESLASLKLPSLSVQPAEDRVVNIRFADAGEAQNTAVINTLTKDHADLTVLRTDFIGGVVSKEITQKAFVGVLFSLIAIALFIAYAFRKVSGLITSWDYGWGALIALAHDILITIGVFAVLGHFYGVEVGVPFIAALLTILGYSVNDTIVVYDRVRENLLRKKHGQEGFVEIVNRSLNETLGRSLSTSLTVIITLLAIVLYGGESTFSFALALLVGVAFGTYSSIFVASALLVSIYEYKMKRRA